MNVDQQTIQGGPLNGFTIHSYSATAHERAVLDMDAAETLGYVRPSDEWVDEHGEPLPDALQVAAHSIGWLLDDRYGHRPVETGGVS